MPLAGHVLGKGILTLFPFGLGKIKDLPLNLRIDSPNALMR